jgi:hypothetical protein
MCPPFGFDETIMAYDMPLGGGIHRISSVHYQTPAGFALHLTTSIARPAARNESSARRVIAQPAPIGGNDH